MIICTAGHVDHGKTALLEALTGKHTAHLPEEKKRGLTIDLGYAYLPMGAETLGFIDVPGHQRFLSNMLAGVGGIQHALLVVAADEGVKPQTEAHLTILRLLQFPHIHVVITKADRATAAQIDGLIAQLKNEAGLADAAFFVTSAHTGEGIAALKQHLSQLQSVSRPDLPFRYAIDRVFHVKGAGLVVTGTAVAGQVAVGDVLWLSSGETVRVRQIHAQNQPAEQGRAGQRLALNVANVAKSTLQRGDWLTTLPPQRCDRISVRLTPAQPLKENQAVHLYHYASHTTGKLNLLNAPQAVDHRPIFAEIVLAEPLPIVFGDKLIVRSGDDRHTLAGATVLELNAPKRHKRHETHLAWLAAVAETTSLAERLAIDTQQHAVAVDQLMWREQQMAVQGSEWGYLQHGNWLFTSAFQQRLEQQMVAKLAEYHQQHPDQLGVTKARLHRMAALAQPAELVYAVMDQLVAAGQLAQTRGWLHTPEHRIAFSPEEQQRWAAVLPLFLATDQALWVRDVANALSQDETQMRNLLYKAGKLGYLVPIVKDRFLRHEQVSDFAQRIKAFIAEHGAISVNQLRDEIGYGRKLTVQLIEYFDRTGFLRRKGNVHLLRDVGTY